MEEEKNIPKFVEAYGKHGKDVGSAGVQIALSTQKINHLTGHLKEHKKDKHSRYGLVKLVSRRRKLLKYLKRTDNATYLKLIKDLGLRK